MTYERCRSMSNHGHHYYKHSGIGGPSFIVSRSFRTMKNIYRFLPYTGTAAIFVMPPKLRAHTCSIEGSIKFDWLTQWFQMIVLPYLMTKVQTKRRTTTEAFLNILLPGFLITRLILYPFYLLGQVSVNDGKCTI